MRVALFEAFAFVLCKFAFYLFLTIRNLMFQNGTCAFFAQVQIKVVCADFAHTTQTILSCIFCTLLHFQEQTSVLAVRNRN